MFPFGTTGEEIGTTGPCSLLVVFGARGYREGQDGGGEGLSVPAADGGGGGGCYNGYIKRKSLGGEDGLREAGPGG